MKRHHAETRPSRQVGSSSKPLRIAFDQLWEMAAKVGSSRSMRRRSRKARASFSMTARSRGIPTDRLLLRVESIETKTALRDSSMELFGVMIRSRIGLPYLCSPSWK